MSFSFDLTSDGRKGHIEGSIDSEIMDVDAEISPVGWLALPDREV